MSTTLKLIKLNNSTTWPTVTPLSSPNLSSNYNAIVLYIAQQVINAVGVIIARKALPKPAFAPKTPKGLIKDNLKPKEAKA